jgi:hypothetical protein
MFEAAPATAKFCRRHAGEAADGAQLVHEILGVLRMHVDIDDLGRQFGGDQFGQPGQHSPGFREFHDLGGGLPGLGVHFSSPE